MNSRAAMFEVAVGLLVLGAGACTKQEVQEPVKRVDVQATSALFEINGISAQLKHHASLAAAVPYYDLVTYSYISCGANWNQHCSGEYDFAVPPNYQACKAIFAVASTNNSQGYSFTPTRPLRFRGYHLHIEANGSFTFLNQWGSNIRLTNVGIRVIAATANNSDRYAVGCDAQ